MQEGASNGTTSSSHSDGPHRPQRTAGSSQPSSAATINPSYLSSVVCQRVRARVCVDSIQRRVRAGPLQCHGRIPVRPPARADSLAPHSASVPKSVSAFRVCLDLRVDVSVRRHGLIRGVFGGRHYDRHCSRYRASAVSRSRALLCTL